MRVEEFPAEARETVDRLLADEELCYRSISEALAARGFSITPGDIGRYAARKADEARREKALSRQLDELERWIRKHPGFDLAGAALTMAIGGSPNGWRATRRCLKVCPPTRRRRG
jgi:hypothetical protein